MHTPLLTALYGRRFVQALELMPLPPSALEFLSSPDTVLRTRIRIRMDNGDQRAFYSWRLRFGRLFGPSKGGVRFHPEVNEQNLSELAARILLKCAANELPHGGAAGGIAVEPKELSATEKERLARAYIRAYIAHIGGERDILSPDLGTDRTTMAWMSDEYDQLRGRFEPAAINGKPPALGGIACRHGATARGAFACLTPLFADWDEPLAGASCAIQGCGAAGATLAHEATQRGMRVLALSDTSGGWFKADGLPVDTLLAAKARGTPLAAIPTPGAQILPPQAVLETPVDWVFAAATAGQIVANNAPRLACKGVIEIANAAVDSDAEPILCQRGIKVVPDIVVNAGGITVSHFEWAQGRTGIALSEHEANRALDQRMQESARRLLSTAGIFQTSLPVAAQLIALERLKMALSI